MDLINQFHDAADETLETECAQARLDRFKRLDINEWLREGILDKRFAFAMDQHNCYLIDRSDWTWKTQFYSETPIDYNIVHSDGIFFSDIKIDVRQLCKIDSHLDLDTVQTYRFPFREYIVQHDKGCAILKW